MSAKISIIIPVYNVEDHIEKMLESVKNQAFTNFEVIIINDGSTDGSQQIIDKFCCIDERFKSYEQENKGVSHARNKGIELAVGDYLAFYDPDDFIPKNALKDLIKIAEKEAADLVIGMMQLKHFGEVISVAARELATKNNINKFEPKLNWSMSVCNKLFRHSVIKDNDLKFAPIKHCEDGLFYINYVHRCNKISGCNSVVYTYKKRPFWEETSALQTVDKESLEDSRYVFDCMMKTVKDSYYVENDLPNEKFLIYLNDLSVHFIHQNLLTEHYRRIWSLNTQSVNMIKSNIIEIKDTIPQKDWDERIISKNKDLRLEENTLMTKEDLSNNPIISFVISDLVDNNSVEQIIRGLYAQAFPAFEVLIHEDLASYIAPGWTQKENFRILTVLDNHGDRQFKREVLDSVKGQYVNFIDEEIFVTMHSITKAYEILTSEPNGNETIFATLPLFKVDNTNIRPIHYPIKNLDWMWGNKIFDVDRLKELDKIKLDKVPANDNSFYSGGAFEKNSQVVMLTGMDKDEIFKNVKNPFKKIVYKIRIFIYRKQIRLIEWLKERAFIVKMWNKIK